MGFVGYEDYENGKVVYEFYSEDSSDEDWKETARDEFGWEPMEDDEDEVEAVLEAAPTKNYALKTPATAKESKAEKFDALFDDEDDNDLPF